MKDIPDHLIPKYTESIRNNSLFHYTTAEGLKGILTTGKIWSTAYYCTNDDSELSVGRGLLRPIFNNVADKLIEEKDSRVAIFASRGVDIKIYSRNFEQIIISRALSVISVYITCFCVANNKEDFNHGILSQWRGYGIDGGYAIQFDKEKLLDSIDKVHKSDNLNYFLEEIFYSSDNKLKSDVLSFEKEFISAFDEYLSELAKPINFNKFNLSNPTINLLNGPLEALFAYLIHTKNEHFSEERENRLSYFQPHEPSSHFLKVKFYNRSGLLVPYIETPSSFNLLDCIDWIVVGPSPHSEKRFQSVRSLIKQSGKKIAIRPSHIPYTRY